MASDAEVRYHRSFLSPYYLDNLNPPAWFEKARRKREDMEVIRLRDPVKFEDTRKSLAKAMNIPYFPGMYLKKPNQFVEGATYWQEGTPSDYAVAEVLEPTQPPQAAVKHPTTGMIALPNVQYAIDAYVDGKPQHTAQMFPKTDQYFETYASPWELIWSNLSYPYTRGFTPIIDNSYNVIGHFGEVDGGSSYGDSHRVGIRIPLELVGKEGYNLRQLMDKKVPIFVHSHTGLLPGWGIGDFYTTEHTIEVRTGLDGEVVDFQVKNKGYLIQPWYSPSDIFVAGRVLVKLTTAIGTKVATSLMRTATAKLPGRAVLNGATEALAKDGIKAAEKDAAKDAAKVAAKDEAKTVVKQVTEADLVPLARNRGASRILTPAQMETYLKDVLAKKPWLARLRAAHKLSGRSRVDALLKVLQEWKDRTGKLFLPVNKGSVARLGSSGEGGWALDRLSGKEVLIIEKEAVNSSEKFLTEVTHELSYEAVREAGGIPALNDLAGIQRFSMDWLERVITDPEGARVWGQLLSMGR
jgi:hypothetical protein